MTPGQDIQSLGGEIGDGQARDELAFQTNILQDVSRTFALTIPQLPPALETVVGNAYLLCRIADTVEDAEELDSASKQSFTALFVDVVAARCAPASFVDALSPLLDERTPAPERELVRHTARVVRLTYSFNDCQRSALERCVAIMGRGMAHYQEAPSLSGLESQSDLDSYCYFVAGVVGEMLTDLFCDYCPEMAAERSALLELGVSFGQGLQMTNILKDVWADRRRGACWLPRSVFARHGVELAGLQPGVDDARYSAAFDELIGIAHGHLCSALEYTLKIPPREQGMRRFCLWALGMAVMTLRKLHSHPGYAAGDDVKISRRTVRATVAYTSAIVRWDTLLRGSLAAFARPLPAPPSDYVRANVSAWETHN